MNTPALPATPPEVSLTDGRTPATTHSSHGSNTASLSRPADHAVYLLRLKSGLSTAVSRGSTFASSG